jgi:ribosomal protein L6P/L9E
MEGATNDELVTSDATLDLSHTSVSNFAVLSTNANGTTFTVKDVATAFAIAGGPGQDTIVANGFAFTADQRNAIFSTASIEKIIDTTGTYYNTAPSVTPTVSLSINNSDVNVANGTGTVTFAFNETPTSFALADTSAVGGTLSNLQQTDAAHYTATFTGAANTDISNGSVSVTAASYQDLTGNAGAGGSTTAFTVDTVTPTVAVSIDNTDVNIANDTGTLTFAFSEAPTSFALTDTSAVGGTLSNLQQTDATHYTATFTGAANTDISAAQVSVTTSSWSEVNGNPGSGGSTPTFTVDTVTPTVAVSINNPFINQAHTTGTVTFTFSEAPTPFALADTSAVGGTLSNLAGAGNTCTATFTGAAKTHITNASVSVTAGSWQENNSNPGGGGSTALFEVDTLTTPQLPTIAVSDDPTAMRGQVIALSTLVAISDRFGLGFQNLELWDSSGTVAGGQFVVNGTPQTGGHEINVTPANVASTVFDVGTAGGTDTLWAQLLQSNGQLTGWQEFTITAPMAQLPTLAVSSSSGATRGQTIGLSSLVSILDPDHVGYTQLELWDSNGTIAGGQFVVNGNAQTGGHEIDVTPANLASTVFDVGTAGGTDTLWAQLDVGGKLSGWEEFTVAAPIDTGPVVTPVSSTKNSVQGQSFAASSLFTYSDPVGSVAVEYDFWDTGSGGGHFVLNSTPLSANQDNIITAAQLSQLTYQVGSGTDTLWVRANDGAVWGAWSQSFTISDPSTISAGETLDLASAFAGNVTFTGPTGTLKLDNSSSFSGTVSGLAGHDMIDFADMLFATVEPPSFSGNSQGGTLTVTDGSHTANLALLGNYLASTFVASSDGHGGTNIIDPPLSASTHPLSLAPSHA